MTQEERMMKKVVSQILADAGINRETIIETFREEIGEKADKAIMSYAKETFQSLIRRELVQHMRDVTKELVREALISHQPTFRIIASVENPKGETSIG